MHSANTHIYLCNAEFRSLFPHALIGSYLGPCHAWSVLLLLYPMHTFISILERLIVFQMNIIRY
jgi:hypothetical protein